MFTMDYVEKKIDSLLRRVSSKSRRRAARRSARRAASNKSIDENSKSSGSGSETSEECAASDSSNQNPKCGDRKSLANRRFLPPLHKVSSLTKLPTLNSTSSTLNSTTLPNNEGVRSTPQPLPSKSQRKSILIKIALLSNHQNPLQYLHIWIIISLYKLQQAFLTLLHLRRIQTIGLSDNEVTNGIGTYEKLISVDQSGSAIIPHHSANSSSEEDKLLIQRRYNKRCESEDAAYVSDNSIPTRQRSSKSINELDMSMDESLAESVGRESGYLSGVDLSFLNRGSSSSGESPALSPRGFSFGREKPLILGHHQLKLSKASFEAERIVQSEDASVEKQLRDSESILSITYPMKCARKEDVMCAVPDYETTETMLKSAVTETKYVTAIFEVTEGGLHDILDDVINEFNRWFGAHIGLMGIACEIHWSCPNKYRNRFLERRMKEALHWSLRENNRRLLNLKNMTKSRTERWQLPLTLIGSNIDENCMINKQLDCFQGIYRRFYTSLLEFQHAETGERHAPYWTLDKITTDKRNSPIPNPQHFVYGSEPTQLDCGSIVAVNVVALRISL